MANVLSGAQYRGTDHSVLQTVEGFALQSTDLSTTLSSGHSTSLTWLLLLLPKPLGSRQRTRDPHGSPLTSEPPSAQSHSCSQVLLPSRFTQRAAHRTVQ